MFYRCQQCQYQTKKWSGQCNECGEWNTFQEVADEVRQTKGRGSKKQSIRKSKAPAVSNIRSFVDNPEQNSCNNYIETGISGLDSVLSGGFIADGVTLLAGQPGIGKSTLALQVAARVSQKQSVLYISGEESKNQVGGRLARLTKTSGDLDFVTGVLVEEILRILQQKKHSLVVIDSVQTLISEEFTSQPGSMTQVRYGVDVITQMAKALGIAVIFIGHVTKDGAVAGPKTLEHIVDTVLVLEGDRSGEIRLLQCLKHRFGPTNNASFFHMQERGLITLENPSKFLLKERNNDAYGSVLTCAIEGNTPFLLEVQALVTKTSFGYPKRATSGFESKRLDILIAVIQKYLGVKLEEYDIYVNLVGGITIKDRGFDLAVVAAILSSFTQEVVGDQVIFGEVGLTGEIRKARHWKKRQAFVEKHFTSSDGTTEMQPMKRVQELAKMFSLS
jgi:DNA repair protein RadA/Sms